MRLVVAGMVFLAMSLTGCILGPCASQRATFFVPGSFEQASALEVQTGGFQPVTKSTGDGYVSISQGPEGWSIHVNSTDEGWFFVEVGSRDGLQKRWKAASTFLGLEVAQLRDVECRSWKGFPS